LLGWLNATFQLSAASPFDGNSLLLDLSHEVGRSLAQEDIEIAHFKTTLTPDEGIGDLAVLNLVGTDRVPELSHRLREEMRSGELIVNLRAEGEPEVLRETILKAVSACTARVEAVSSVVHVDHFRPAKPSPTHRFATA
jgi:hypothetical protein